MDQSTHEVRLANWESIVHQCQSRPEGQATKQWLADNNISDKQYYYWLRKIRKRALDEADAKLPAVSGSQTPQAIAFAEIPAEAIASNERDAAVTIKTAKSTIQISSAVSESTMLKLVKAVAHAL